MKKKEMAVLPELKYLVVDIPVEAAIDAAQQEIHKKIEKEVALKCVYDYDDGSAYLVPKTEKDRASLEEQYSLDSLTQFTGAMMCGILGLEPACDPYVEYTTGLQDGVDKLRVYLPWDSYCLDILKELKAA